MEYYKYLRQYLGHRPIILPGSVVLMLNKQEEILLQKGPNGNWGLPGGLMDLGESFEEVARREVLEETGLVVENLTLLNVYAGSDYYLKVANGDELYSATAVYYTKDYTGTMEADGEESVALKFFNLENLPRALNQKDKGFITDYIKHREENP